MPALLAVLALAPAAGPADDPVVVERAAHAPVTLNEAALGRLSMVSLQVSFGTGRGPFSARFEGPLLWAVLAQADAIDAKQPRLQASEVVRIVGRDGYAADVAVGEISPVFEGKQVILAERMDGHPLGSGHVRLVVPGDASGGRSVRDVGRIWVSP